MGSAVQRWHLRFSGMMMARQAGRARRRMTVEQVGLGEILARAERFGDRVAASWGAARLTYAELAAASARLASGLASLGLRHGDRVAFWLPNLPEYLVALFACARLGLVATAVNTRFRAGEVGDIVGRSGARALIFWPTFNDIPFTGILDGVEPAALDGVEFLICHRAPGEPALTVPPASVRRARVLMLDDLAAGAPLMSLGLREHGAAIFTTSGTTRAPKFVLHRQASLIDHARHVAADFGYDRPDARVLQAVPLCGVFGFAQAMAGLYGGAELVLMPVFDEARAYALCREGRVTQFNGTDDMLMRLIRRAEADGLAAGRAFPALRFVGFAAFGLNPAEVVARADAVGLTALGLYGMSEVQALFARQAEDAPPAERAKPGGRPVASGYMARVCDPGDGRPLPVGEAGELQLKGPSVMAGYFGNEAATAEAFTADGWFRTGDLARLEPDGRFEFLTRMGDVLRLGGFLVAPAEIEARLEQHPAVAAAQVVGAATPTGVRAVAFVVPKAGGDIDEAEMQAHCRQALAAFKTPARIVAVEAFPVTQSANGVKIQRAKLREMASALLADG